MASGYNGKSACLGRLRIFQDTTTRGSTPFRISIVLPVVVELRLAVVQVQDRHVLGFVARAA